MRGSVVTDQENFSFFLGNLMLVKYIQRSLYRWPSKTSCRPKLFLPENIFTGRAEKTSLLIFETCKLTGLHAVKQLCKVTFPELVVR